LLSGNAYYSIEHLPIMTIPSNVLSSTAFFGKTVFFF
jgi:hypothetical protein